MYVSFTCAPGKGTGDPQTQMLPWEAPVELGRSEHDREGHSLPCLITDTRTWDVWFPAEESTEQRYSALSRMASRSQLRAWALPSGSTCVCTGTHVSRARPFFSQAKWISAGPGGTQTITCAPLYLIQDLGELPRQGTLFWLGCA